MLEICKFRFFKIPDLFALYMSKYIKVSDFKEDIK